MKPTFVLVKIGTRLNAVLRASEISHRPVADPGQVFSPGDKIKCMLLPGAFSEGVKDNVLVSTKALEPTPGDMLVDPAAVYRQAEATAKQLEEAFRPGTVHEGTVSIVNPYAVIVSMGVLGGILHVSQISNDHVASAADVFKVGDKIKCMVRKVEAWRLSLSTKELEPAPGDMLRDRALVFATAEARAKQVQTTFEVGAVLEGVVTRIKPVGVFVNIGGVREGLLHVSQISNAFVADIRNLFTVGEKVKCMVIASDEEQARVQLSTKTLEPTPGDMLKDSAGVYQNAEEVASKLFAAGDGRAGVPPNAPPARALKETLPTQAATHSEWGEAVRDCLRQSRREDATFNCVLLRRGQDGYFGVVSDVPGMAELAAFLPFNEATEGLGGPQLSGPVAEAFFRQQLEVCRAVCCTVCCWKLCALLCCVVLCCVVLCCVVLCCVVLCCVVLCCVVLCCVVFCVVLCFVLCCVVLCCVVLCCVVLCCVVLCCVVLCFVLCFVLCCVVLCCVVLCCVVLCCVVLCCVVLCCVLCFLFCVVLCCVVLCCVVLCCVVLCCVVLCCVVLCCVVLCCVVFCVVSCRVVLCRVVSCRVLLRCVVLRCVSSAV